jgi:hypothetical protein
LIEPAGEGVAKALAHGANPDVGGQRQKKRHKCQRQARKLLARVGPEPLGFRPLCEPFGNPQTKGEHEGQCEGGSHQKSAQKHKACQKPLAPNPGSQRQGRDPQGRARLQQDRAAVRSGPGAWAGRCQDRKPGDFPKRARACNQRARKRNPEARHPPCRPKRQTALDGRPVKPA